MGHLVGKETLAAHSQCSCCSHKWHVFIAEQIYYIHLKTSSKMEIIKG